MEKFLIYKFLGYTEHRDGLSIFQYIFQNSLNIAISYELNFLFLFHYYSSKIIVQIIRIFKLYQKLLLILWFKYESFYYLLKLFLIFFGELHSFHVY